jgi:hypothetical protein
MPIAEKVPPSLSKLQLPTGVHRRWLKLVVFGGWKSGKSTFLSYFPPPLVAIDCGDGGISSYLPKGDPNYVSFEITTPQSYDAALEFVFKNQAEINSVVIDPLTELWTDHMAWWETELNVDEIKGGQWKKVKVPWKVNLQRLKRAPFHVGYAAWTRDTEYKEGPAAPGEKGALEIKAQEVPQMERTVGYSIDMILETKAVLDKLNKPTGKHEVIFWGGRRPQAVPPEMLYIGKKWTFDARKPVNVWNEVVGPLLDHWKEGAVDVLGLDPQEAERMQAESDMVVQDEALGRLIRMIEAQTELHAYAEFFKNEVQPEFVTLSNERQVKIKEVHEKKKAELMAAAGKGAKKK